MKHNKSTVTTEEKHLHNCKNNETKDLYLKLRAIALEFLEDVTTAATAYYVSWSIDGGRQFANFYIQKKKVRILTLKPLRKYAFGENVPDTHGYTLNYQTDIFENEDIEKVKGIILDSYNQIKQLI